MVSAVGHFSGGPRTAREWEEGVTAHQDLARHAADAGVTLAFEPLNRFETYFINTMEDGAAFATAVGHPAFGILYDSFHANIEAKDPIAAYNCAREHINHVHIAENDRGIPGEGHIDYAALFETLRDTKYDGWLTIEAFSQSLPELAAATRIWRPLYPDFQTLASQGYEFIRRSWSEAAQ
jgi:D-psicose/D-tagatose/L-ribulose 3-epimerase